MGKWSIFGAHPSGFGLECEAPSALSPNSSPERAGGRGTKAGQGARPGWGRVWRQLEAHLMAARRAGGTPTMWVLPGRPWLELQGFGVGSRFCSVSPRVPPHRVRLPGRNVDGARAGLRAPPPSGGLIQGVPAAEGGAASPPRRAPSTGGGYNVTLTTVLLFATFRSKIPLPAPTMPCALKGPRTT